MRKIRCIIIEDEPLAVNVLRDYTGQVPQLQLMQVFHEVVSAREYLENANVELIFLDIHLPKISGLDFLRSLKNPPAIIITSAHNNYAIDGFDLGVADYLLKPISFPRFFSAVTKVIGNLSEQSTAKSQTPINDYLFLTVNRKKVRILFDEILYVESRKEYVEIITPFKLYVSKISTSELEELLPSSQFKRVHRSFIIALNKVSSYTKEHVEIHGKLIPIGRTFKKDYFNS